MRLSQKPIVILAASLILPPAGLILLWLRKGTSVFRKSLGSLAIVMVGVAHLFLFYGMHMEFSGGIGLVFSFQGGERHYRQLEAHRAAFQAPAPAIVEAAPAAPAAPAKAESVPASAFGSTYWADFLGPGRLGHYDQKPILTDWPAGGLHQVWKQPVGGGYASFTAANGLAFTIEQRRRDEVVAAYDIRTGRERWTHSWKALFEEVLGGNGPRATPVWEDGRVYALGAEGELRCLESATGKLIWNKNILADNGASNLHWGMAASPLVVDGKVIVTPGGGHGNSVVAYDKLSGLRVWGSLDDQAAYASPTLATVGEAYAAWSSSDPQTRRPESLSYATTELPCPPPGVTITLPSTTRGDAAIPQWRLDAPLSARMFLFQMSLPVADSRQRSSPSAPSA